MDFMKWRKRVNNPCIICLQSVKKKNGLQCQGACRKWAHYTCLNLSPGKIKDIKAGIITVVCPCLRCESQEKFQELLPESRVLCDLMHCPANTLSRCEDSDCPLNNRSRSQQDKVGSPCSPDFCPQVPRISRHKLPHQATPYDDRNQLQRVKTSVFNDPLDEKLNYSKKIPTYSPELTSDPGSIKPLPASVAPKKQPGMVDNTCSPIKTVSCSLVMDKKASPMEDDSKTKKDQLRHSDSKLVFLRREEKKKVLLVIRKLCSTVGDLSNEIRGLMTKILHEPGDNSSQL